MMDMSGRRIYEKTNIPVYTFPVQHTRHSDTDDYFITLIFSLSLLKKSAWHINILEDYSA